MNRKVILFLILQLAFVKAYCQLETYYHKIEQVAYNESSATKLFDRIDSIKKTRRPNDSNIERYFNRDIDFGYKHQRIYITFNRDAYQVNLISKNDSIYFCSVLYGNSPMIDDEKENIQRQNHPKIDTLRILKYIQLHNNFYHSSETIKNLINDLNRAEVYAFYCGDGMPKTKKGKEIERLVNNKKITKLHNLLSSFSCEQQAFGVAGFKMLVKNGFVISENTAYLIKHVDDRDSELAICSGCFITTNKGILNHLIR